MRRPTLSVQRLETRTVPAAITFAGGNLRVVANTGNDFVEITETAGSVHVRIGETSYGTYRVTGNLSIDSGNGNDFVSVRVNSGLAGKLDVSAGLGDDNIQLLGTNGASGIQGATTVNQGYGNDRLTVGSRLRMSSLTIAGDLGNDSFFFDSGNIAGNLVMNGVNQAQLGTGFTGPPSVGGAVIDNASTEGVPSSFYLIGDAAIGSLTYLGSPAGSDVQIGDGIPRRPIRGEQGGLFGGTVHGNASVGGGNGGGGNRFAIYAGAIDGSVSVQGGNGSDLFDVRDFGDIAGSLTMNLGNGNNTLLAQPDTFFVGGNYSVQGGNGNDVLTDSFDRGQLTLGFAPQVAGNFSVNLGNGDNAFNFGGSVGGKLSYTGGGGIDRVDLRSTVPISRVEISLGAGDDFLTLRAGFACNSGLFDFGAGDDTYDDAGIVFGNNLTLLNLP